MKIGLYLALRLVFLFDLYLKIFLFLEAPALLYKTAPIAFRAVLKLLEMPHTWFPILSPNRIAVQASSASTCNARLDCHAKLVSSCSVMICFQSG